MRVTVVGGGVIGLTIAWRAAQRGADVTVVDPDTNRGASRVAAGMLAPVAEVARGEEALQALSLASALRWPAFASALEAVAGQDPGYTRTGTLIVARDADELGDLNELLLLQQQAGLSSERVSSRQARKLEPALAPAIRGGLWLPDDHQVDNRMLLAALSRAAHGCGVGFVGEPARAITGDTVTTASGVSIESDSVVVATGAWPPPISIDGRAIELPLRPVKGQIVRVQATGAAIMPTRSVRGMGIYIVPRTHGEIAIGATVEERGYDTSVTVGGVHQLLRDAWELVPGLSEAAFVEASAGLRPGTPDNAPLLGRVGGATGPIVAGGHHRHGLLLAPITADVVMGWVFGDHDAELDRLARPLTPNRFGALEAVPS